jgi:membrane carboxypeptidase/penicillin-binding protein PbpC
MRPRLRLPSFRRFLLSLHDDLLRIHDKVDLYAWCWPERLTEFERLVITLEDRRFFRHSGVDLKGVAREFSRILILRKPRGASTIDMQFVRTATGRYERSVRRKLREILLSCLMQFRYPKIVILRSYLQIAYFGTGLRGAQSATPQCADEISGMPAALLAAHLVYPRPAQESKTWEKKLLRRANYIYSIYVRRKKRFEKLERRVFSDIV